MDIAKHVDELRKKIRRASELYYDKDSPEISDYEYDMMFEELKKLEEEKKRKQRFIVPEKKDAWDEEFDNDLLW